MPDRYLSFPGFALSPGQWDSLQIPVEVAFFFLNSTLDRVAAFYPSPAGATESLLSLDAWGEVVAANPGLATLAPRRRGVPRTGRPPGGAAAECFLVPIDACYELVGQLRRLWRGFDGGQEAHDAWTPSSPACRAQPARSLGSGSRMSSLSFEVLGARPSPTPRCRRCCSACASASLTRSRSTPSRCAAR